MKNTQKGFIVPLLLLIVAVLLVGGGAYFYTQTKSENPPVTENVTLPQATSTTQTSNQTAPVALTSNSQTTGWKTYRNDDFGFEIKYPLGLNVIYSKQGQGSATAYIQESSSANDTSNVTKNPRLYTVFVGDLSGSTMINGVLKPMANLSLKEIISEGLAVRKCNPADTLINWEPISAGGVAGIEATSKNGDACLNKYLPWVAFEKDNRIYDIQFSRGSIEEFNQILSTFKFTQTTPALQIGIIVNSPKPNDLVTLPITVQGQISGNGWAANEGETGTVQIFDANGKAISSVAVLTATTDWLKLPTSFQAMVGDRQMISSITTNTGYLKFTSKAEKDGQTQLTFTVPIKFK